MVPGKSKVGTQTGRRGFKIGLFKSSWANPAPDDMIASLDFTAPGTAPFLIAITTE